jgi:carbonic anhydrase
MPQPNPPRTLKAFHLPPGLWVAALLALAAAQPGTAVAGGDHDGSASRPAARAEPPADAMDALRQKLADRLGAQKAGDAKDSQSASTLKVDNRATAAAAATAGHDAGKKPTAAAPRAAGHDDGTVTLAPRAPRPRPSPKPVAKAATESPAHGHAAHVHWGYQGAGAPEAWADLKPEFRQCAVGQRQSPIDIRGGIAVQLEPIQFDYRTTGFSVIDNGHTVQVNLPSGNTITVLGRRYELLQFHFHRPSEERINGKQFDMVAHLVHKDAEGRLAVVAVLLDRGAAQPLIQAVWNALPLEKNEAQAAPGTIDLNRLLPEDRRYYTYMGSLTTPPCSEGVLWMVMKTPVQVSPEQIEIFSRLYPMNARPIQPIAGRLIKESN